MHDKYLTYVEYIEKGGIAEEAAFALSEFKARKVIDYWTDSRVQNMQEVPEAVKFCMFALITIESKFGAEAIADKPVVSSFNTDGYSESYGSATEQSAAARKAVSDSSKQWLYGETDDEGTPLLYRGVRG